MVKYKVRFFSETDATLGIQYFETDDVQKLNEDIRKLMLDSESTFLEIEQKETITGILKSKIAGYTITPGSVRVLK
ncbi:hypothetical protein [Ureibacillus sp. FSL K6-2830]|uniref:hypothetical protein n=1 Tax=Ureibacillus sp. FSL K6-2830 TaxID=2954610 RepID=UPI0030F8AAF8